MEEAKTKKTKAISIKNKKTAKQTLAKASIKGKSAPKAVKKATAIKIKPKTASKDVVKKETNEKIDTKKANLNNKTNPTALKKKNRTVKEPNNIKRKITKEEKNIIEKEIKQEKNNEHKQEEKKEIRRIALTEKEKRLEEKKKRKEEKKKQKQEKRKKRKEKKEKAKEEKKRLKEKERKDKKIEKEKENQKKKNKKIEFPKEWKTINSKNSKVVKEIEEKPKTFKGKIKHSIFESVDEKELQERKKKSKESLKKTIIVLLIIIVTIGIAAYSLIKYNDYVRKQLAIYDSFRIGDKVQLKDNSVWYVINDSDSKEDQIKLLSSNMVDVNFDGVIDSNDLVNYNTTNKAEYDSSNEGSAAFLLNDSIKKKYEESVGKIEEMSLLTSKEYVKIRERMNYGDEWYTGNWLASGDFQKWWIQSEQNEKVFVVTAKGTFYLTNAGSSYYIRPTIVIDKDSVTKIEEKKEITMDLINGLKRK